MINTNFPKTFEHALSDVAQKAGWSLKKYEYHGVQVRELLRWEGNMLRKIQANLREDQKIQVIIDGVPVTVYKSIKYTAPETPAIGRHGYKAN